MKKLLSLVLVVLILTGVFIMPVSAEDEISVLLNGEFLEFDVPPQIINGRTLVPMRKIFESLGYEVDWEKETKTAIAVSIERTIRITIDSYTMYVNDEEKALDVPACIIDGRTLVPARAISEASGYKVDWEDYWRAVTITDPIDSEANKFDALKEYIIKHGEYNSENDMYIMYGGVCYAIYMNKSDIIELYLSVTLEGKDEIVVFVSLNKDSDPYVYMKYVFASGTVNEMTGQYTEKGSPFEVLEANVSEELYDDAISLINEAVQYHLDFSLKAITGISLTEFGVKY